MILFIINFTALSLIWLTCCFNTEILSFLLIFAGGLSSSPICLNKSSPSELSKFSLFLLPDVSDISSKFQ